MHAVWSCHYALPAVFTKKRMIGNYQDMLNVIQHALTIVDLAIDHPVLLEIICKITVIEGGNSHLVKKLSSPCFLSVCFLGI